MDEKFSILKHLKKQMLGIIATTIVIAGCLSTLFLLTNNHDYESRVIINVLSRQRMLTQVIAKDATRIYTLRDSLEHNTNYYAPDVARSKISDTRKDLFSAMETFENTLYDIEGGYITYNNKKLRLPNPMAGIREPLEKIKGLWIDIRNSAETLANESSNSDNVNKAVIFINDNNETLLNYSDQITNTLVESAKVESRKAILGSGIIVLIAFAVLILLLHNIYRYLLIPLRELYKGIAEIGISGFNTDFSMPAGKKVLPVITEVNEVFHKLNRLITLIENINGNNSFKEVLDYIYSTFSAYIPYTYIGIALMENDGKCLKASYGVSDGTAKGLPQNLLGTRVEICDTSLGKIIESGKPRIINDLEEYVDGKPQKDYNKAILYGGIRSSITFPLKVNDRPVGIIFFSSKYKNVYKKEHLQFLNTLANSISLSLDKNIFTGELLYSTILALAKLAESRDQNTGDHLQRMKIYSEAIAEILKTDGPYKESITPDFLDELEKFSPLHDIGKVGIKDGILLKPAKLTHEEFETMKLHTLYGADVLKTAESYISKSGRSLFKTGIEIAESHHERWDGSGYPHGKKAEDIPLSARIVTLADVFDALTTMRPYKPAYSFDASLDIIREGSAKHFDPEIVRVFVENRDKIEEIHKSFSPTS